MEEYDDSRSRAQKRKNEHSDSDSETSSKRVRELIDDDDDSEEGAPEEERWRPFDSQELVQLGKDQVFSSREEARQWLKEEILPILNTYFAYVTGSDAFLYCAGEESLFAHLTDSRRPKEGGSHPNYATAS